MAAQRSCTARDDLLALAVFTCVAVLYLRPIFGHLDTRIVVDAGDPALNAAILAWNATVLPFTDAWWNQPWFHPATGITTFTENLVGLAPIATPIYWITHNPVATYNVTLFASFPLSAFAACFLVRHLTGRSDAGLVAGLAFGFMPYRASAELGHLQSLCAFWLPIGLAALHAYLKDRRRRWLVLFGVMWLLQSLANGYYMLLGGLLIVLWLLYFGTSTRNRPAAAAVVGAWVVASLPLVPVLLRYKHVHEYYGLGRTLAEALAFSAHPDSFVEAPGIVRLWSGILPTGREMLFPGLTVLLITAIAAIVGLSGSRSGSAGSRRWRAFQATLATLTVVSAAAAMFWLGHGPWSIRAGGDVLLRMNDPDRALLMLAFCGIPLLWIAPVREVLSARHPFVFYGAATVIMGLLACGPVLSVRDTVLLDPSPYRWLMALPGFDQLRVPSRFWMMGALCLTAAAGIGYARLVRGPRVMTYAMCAIVSLGVLADGWLKQLPTAPAPALWSGVRGANPGLPLLELPLGPGWDAAATLRTSLHGRRVMNGVSGYEPPHYVALQRGLREREPEMLEAIAALGAYEVSIEYATDRDGAWKRYVAAASGASLVADDGERAVYRVPAMSRDEPVLGPALSIASVQSHRGDPSPTIDHRLDTPWGDGPQNRDQWLLTDLGSVRRVGGVSLALANHPTGFPRRVAIEVSSDGGQFARIWEGSGAAPAFLAVLRAPQSAWLRIAVPPHDARFVRIRQLGREAIAWIVPELEINAPGPGAGGW